MWAVLSGTELVALPVSLGLGKGAEQKWKKAAEGGSKCCEAA